MINASLVVEENKGALNQKIITTNKKDYRI